MYFWQRLLIARLITNLRRLYMAHVGGAAGRLGGAGVRGALVRGGLHDQFIY